MTSTEDRRRFVVAITDHMMGGPEVEGAIVASIADVDFFDTRDEAAFDAERLARVDALMVWGARLGRRSIPHLVRCRAVVRYGVGYDKVDVAALADAGRIETAVINRLKPFGYRIVVFDPYQPPGHEKAIGYERVRDLPSLLKVSDVVSLHYPATADTRGMIDRRALDLIKPGAVLVNTARGDLLDGLDAVEAGLRSGRLAAAALDVLPKEPPDDHPLLDAWREREDWLAGRLVITQHNAFHSDASGVEMRRNAAETVRLFLEGAALRNLVEPE